MRLHSIVAGVVVVQLARCTAQKCPDVQGTAQCNAILASDAFTCDGQMCANADDCSYSGKCDGVCSFCPCQLIAPLNGQLGTCSDTLLHGHTCSFECNVDHVATGTQPTCDNGDLSPAFSCEPPPGCTGVLAPAHGQLGTCQGTLGHRGSCALRCDSGYQLAGEQPSCDAGQLTQSVVCVETVACAGSWSECGGSDPYSCTRDYTVRVAASGGGAECEAADGTSEPCAAGEGSCPAVRCADTTGTAQCSAILQSGKTCAADFCPGCSFAAQCDGRCGTCPCVDIAPPANATVGTCTPTVLHAAGCAFLCDAGFVAAGGTPVCANSVLEHSSACPACPPGRWSAAGDAECADCPAGFYAEAEASVLAGCRGCAAGRFSPGSSRYGGSGGSLEPPGPLS